MQTYARQGGTSTIFINDDGLQLLSPEDRDARLEFYANHGIGFVARPPHDNKEGGFKRAGRFKKASNMNYALSLSLKIEKHLADLQAQEREKERECEEHLENKVGTIPVHVWALLSRYFHRGKQTESFAPFAASS